MEPAANGVASPIDETDVAANEPSVPESFAQDRELLGMPPIVLIAQRDEPGIARRLDFVVGDALAVPALRRQRSQERGDNRSAVDTAIREIQQRARAQRAAGG